MITSERNVLTPVSMDSNSQDYPQVEINKEIAMAEISCNVYSCKHNSDSICQTPESIVIEDMISCIEVVCDYKVEEEDE